MGQREILKYFEINEYNLSNWMQQKIVLRSKFMEFTAHIRKIRNQKYYLSLKETRSKKNK
jgi:hypothetical protein